MAYSANETPTVRILVVGDSGERVPASPHPTPNYTEYVRGKENLTMFFLPNFFRFPGVGKTSLVHQLAYSKPQPSTTWTVGCEVQILVSK